jgi:archaellin
MSLNNLDISTLALVGLAAIALAVGVTATGVLDAPSRSHGPPPDVEPAIEVRGGHANVSAGGTVERLHLVLSGGSEAVDLSAVSVAWDGPREAVSLVAETGGRPDARSDAVEPGEYRRFSVSPVRDADGSFPVVNADGDRVELVVNATAVRGDPLTGGERVALTFTGDGVVAVYTVELPESLDGEETVAL